MELNEHPNSHIIFIRRAPTFSGEARKALEDYFADSHVGVGSYFGKGTMRTATGLTISEEDLLMPYILSIPKEDRDFRKEVTTFFMNLETKVPAHKTVDGITTGGRALEIGLDSDNNEPVSEKNLPINIEHYIRYRHASGHPFMAKSESAAKGNQLIKYYIYDPEEVSTGHLTVNEAKDNAISKYLTIKDKPQVVRMYLTLLGVKLASIRKGEESMKLREFADKDPAKFISIYEDQNKEVKYLIEEMVNEGVLERVNKRLITSEGDEIGRDIKEAVLYLKDSHNSKMLAILKARLQEKNKNKSISVDTDEDLELAESAGAEVVSKLQSGINLGKQASNPPASTGGTTLDEVD